MKTLFIIFVNDYHLLTLFLSRVLACFYFLEQSEWLTFNLPQFLFLFGYLLNIIYLVLPLFKTVFLIGGILFIFEAVKTIFLSFLKLFNVFSAPLWSRGTAAWGSSPDKTNFFLALG